MSASNPSGADWSNSEIDLIVADYFEMLNFELAGQAYIKAHRNAELQRLTGRSKGSIEFKHQNISAVLVKLGLPWIYGYKPLANFQHALIEGIERRLVKNDDVAKISAVEVSAPARGGENEFSEPEALFIDAPPSLSREPPSDIPVSLTRLIRKFDPAARDARNRALGKRGEERALVHEKARLLGQGRDDLAQKVRWVSEEEGDGAGYDILSFTDDGRDRLLEVKTTGGHSTTPFYLTETELKVSVERPDAFRILRLFDFARAPRAFELAPPLDSCLILTAANYRASFDE
jgi:hypothetical protein